MVDFEATAGTVQELLKLAPGRVRCFIEADFEGVRQSLEFEGPALRRPIVLLKRIEALPTTSQLINDVVLAMATTARNLWPVWFTDVDFGLGRSRADLVAARMRIAELRQVHGLSPIWGRRALPKVMDGKLPLVPGFPRATQLYQLRLAISRTGLVLVMALAPYRYDDAELASLASGAQWLAQNAKLAVAVLLPSNMQNSPGLARILYDPVRYFSPLKEAVKQTVGFEIALDCKANTPATVWVWLGEGRTHPKSEGEAKLASALRNDPELGPLFSANRCVETVFKNCPTVDLLWTRGRLVVEVDGDDHREAYKFAADHRRDFELQISDYAVLRLINHEVLTDTALAVARIREFVHHRRKTRPDLERHP